MRRDWACGILLAMALATCGCAAAVIGMGAAAGVGSAYLAGKDIRTYEAEYHQTVQACLETLNALKIPVTQTYADESKATIRARRADEPQISVEVVRTGAGRSEVGIRTGVVGLTDYETSNQIHDALKQRLERRAHELAKASAARPGPKDAPESSPGHLTRRGPGRRPDEPPPAARAKKAPAELTVYFAVDSNELRPSETTKLDEVVEIVRQQPEARLVLNGYTDSAGPGDYNRLIAESRASSVKLYLVAKGLDPLRIAVIGKGAEGFVASNESEEGRSLNRRVEIRIDAGRPEAD